MYSLLAAAMGVHLADILVVSPDLHTATVRLLVITIIFLWLRILKHVRAFKCGLARLWYCWLSRGTPAQTKAVGHAPSGLGFPNFLLRSVG